MCSFVKNTSGYEAGLKNTCEGDSENWKYTQVGVVSGGVCKNIEKPSIYGRLEDYEVLQFIYQNAFGRDIPMQYSKFWWVFSIQILLHFYMQVVILERVFYIY